MKTYPLIISSPDGDLYRGDVRQIILRGSEGDLAVLAGHVPFVTAIKAGNCVVEDQDGKRHEGKIAEGMMTVDRDKVTVLTSALSLED